MIRKTTSLLILGATTLIATGCALPENEQQSRATTPSLASPAVKPDDLAGLIYTAAQTLGERAESLAKDRPIVVTTIVSVDDLKHSSTFGRLVSELVSNRLAQRGYLVRDVRYTGALELKPETGEQVLSREASEVSKRVRAQAIVAGTYAVAGRKIYVNLRLIKADNAELLSSVDVVVSLNANTRVLFGTPATSRNFVSFDQFEAKVEDKND